MKLLQHRKKVLERVIERRLQVNNNDMQCCFMTDKRTADAHFMVTILKKYEKKEEDVGNVFCRLISRR